MKGNHTQISLFIPVLAAAMLAAAMLVAAPGTRADAVTEANAKAAAVASQIPATPVAVRAMAIVQIAVFEAVNAITQRYPPYHAKIEAAPGASVEAAVAAATRAALSKLVPALQTTIEADYQAALKLLPDGPSKAGGIAVGERAAAAILAWRLDDGMVAPDTYRPAAMAGVYVPTTLPAVPHWARRKPWVMTGGDQFRPEPPPSLTSDIWTRDFNEIKSVGAKNSSARTVEQTAIARFWESTATSIYWTVARSVADAPGREVTENARLLAVAGMAMDDAAIAVFDAKYAYNFWRPITAIRNADLDGNDATAPETGWVPLIDTPMHPEYPCAHCIVSGSIGAVLEAEIGTGPTPILSAASPTAAGAVRTWTSVKDFVEEVAVGRIYDGVHYRNSTEVGTAMGTRIGELAVRSFPKATR